MSPANADGGPTAIRPQPGPQEALLASWADIAIAGGAAGGGKTYGLLLEPLRHKNNGNAGAVFFRRTYPQIRNEGGLWDDAARIYPFVGGEPNENDLHYDFPSGFRIKFAHLQHAKDRFSWKGAQIPLLLFDQLEDFEEQQFWYLTSRNRSATAGFRPYVRGTVNPVPDDDPVGGWLNKLVSWWINQETGYAIPERSGVLRWFVRLNDVMHWADTREQLIERFGAEDPELRPKSLTFIPAKLTDNPILMQQDPDYLGTLKALPLVERERLLGGNWKIKPEAGKVFNRAWFKSLPALPLDIRKWVRYWDKAGTEDGGKYTAGALVGELPNGQVVLANIVRGQWSAFNRERVIKETAEWDRRLPGTLSIYVEQEPGSGGKESAENTVLNLGGHRIYADKVTGDKVERASPLSAQAEGGNVFLCGEWDREAFLAEAHRFDGKGVCDQVDAAAGAFNKLKLVRKPKGGAWGR